LFLPAEAEYWFRPSDSKKPCRADYCRLPGNNPTNFLEPLPAQPVDATPSNRLIGQHFSQGIDLFELYSIKPKQDSAFRLY
jgi:hypothetical protein